LQNHKKNRNLALEFREDVLDVAEKEGLLGNSDYAGYVLERWQIAGKFPV
jgi:hypothetical protein